MAFYFRNLVNSVAKYRLSPARMQKELGFGRLVLNPMHVRLMHLTEYDGLKLHLERMPPPLVLLVIVVKQAGTK